MFEIDFNKPYLKCLQFSEEDASLIDTVLFDKDSFDIIESSYSANINK